MQLRSSWVVTARSWKENYVNGGKVFFATKQTFFLSWIYCSLVAKRCLSTISCSIALKPWFLTFISLPYVILLWFEKIFLIFHSLGPFLFKLLDFVLVFIFELFFLVFVLYLRFFWFIDLFFIFYRPLTFFFFFLVFDIFLLLFDLSFLINSPSTSIQRKGANYKNYY